jgi:hypothetical protein
LDIVANLRLTNIHLTTLGPRLRGDDEVWILSLT